MVLIKREADIPSSEITPRSLWVNRRTFFRSAATAGAAVLAGRVRLEAIGTPAPHGVRLGGVRPSMFSTPERLNSWEAITTYNNYWEFGSDKDDPSNNAGKLQTTPWTVTVEGECGKPGAYDLGDVMKGATLEQRVYRHRCVEGWSMVIPWIGFPLATFLARVKPTSTAQFVEFTSVQDRKTMSGVRDRLLPWPYREALRLDEAMHPLAILAVGLYGEVLPNQNGAPLRLVVPWKYGFKSIKAIVKIRLVDKQPSTTWHDANPSLYGFWANVNPDIYPQATERRLGEFLMRKTEMFNGYGDQVVGLYAGMNLKRDY
jgi:sulfoxide reductase catalytic subunit YedY